MMTPEYSNRGISYGISMPWKKTTPSLLPEFTPNKGTQLLFAEYWGRTTLIFGNSPYLPPLPKPPGRLSRNSLHNMPSMPKFLMNPKKENFPLDDPSIMG